MPVGFGFTGGIRVIIDNKKTIQLLERLIREVPEQTFKVTLNRAKQYARDVRAEIQRGGPFSGSKIISDTGKLAQSIKIEAEKTARGFEIIVGTSKKYAPVIEFGRRPGKFPPPEPIRVWVRRKLKIKKSKDLERVAWLVARKIAKHGTEGRPVFMGWAEIHAKKFEEDLHELLKSIS